MTADPATIQAVQKSAAFRVVDHTVEVERIRQRLRIDLSHIARAMRHLPVNVEGDVHAGRRRAMARAIAARTDAALAAFTGVCRHVCAEEIRPGREVELVGKLFEPAALALAHALSGVELAHNPDFVSPTQIFDRSLGLNRRKLIDAEIGRLWQDACKSVSEDEADMSIALAILGSDTILGSLGLSFAERVASSPGRSLGGIDWGDRLTLTAVPFIERTATEPVRLADEDVQSGDLVRLFLDRYTLEPVAERDAVFGSGRHACLGRPVAQQAWRALGEVLARLDVTLRIESMSYREADCMFLFPREMWVRVDGR